MSSNLTGAALLCVLLFGVGCARHHLFYDTRELRHQPFHSTDEKQLREELERRLRGRQVVWLDHQGREHELVVDEGGLTQLDFPSTAALWLATGPGDVGGENDIRVRIQKKPAVAVSVMSDLEGNIRVESSPRDVAVAPSVGPSKKEIRRRFALKGKIDGQWTVVERRALFDALALLHKDELTAIADVHFARRTTSHRGDANQGALYESKGCVGVVYVFTLAVKADRYRFVGDAHQPRHAVLHSLVHELGHAFEHAGARDRYCAAKRNKFPKRRNALIREGNNLTTRGPIAMDHERVLGDDPAPTDYGRTSPRESFAESFALFHVDAKALRRARPRVFAWFRDGGHIRAQPSFVAPARRVASGRRR